MSDEAYRDEVIAPRMAWDRAMQEIRQPYTDNPTDADNMRQALRHIATDPELCATLPLEDRTAAWDLARGSDDTLAVLYRSIRK